MTKLSHIVKKDNFFVIEGAGTSLIFKYKIDKQNLTCQCKKIDCKHIIYYLCTVLGLRQPYINIVKIPRVKSLISSISDLNKYCSDFLTNEESEYCVICYQPYTNHNRLARASSFNDLDLYQCPQCKELFHEACRIKWCKHSVSCAKCNYRKDIIFS